MQDARTNPAVSLTELVGNTTQHGNVHYLPGRSQGKNDSYPKFGLMDSFRDETIPFTERVTDHCTPKYDWRPHQEDEDTAAGIDPSKD